MPEARAAHCEDYSSQLKRASSACSCQLEQYPPLRASLLFSITCGWPGLSSAPLNAGSFLPS